METNEQRTKEQENRGSQQNATGPKYETGEPGSIGRAGEYEEAHGNVWPASGPAAPAGATPEGMASFGQGIRGAEGYNDTGPSEMTPSQAPQKPAKT